MRLERQPDRLGVGFWLPAMLVSGAVAILFLGMAVLVEGDEWAQRRFGMSGAWLLGITLLTSVCLGIIVGLLNPYVTSRWRAALVGTTACLPVSACAMVAVGVGASHGWVEPFVVTIAIAGVIGGTFGALLYEP